MHQQSTSLHRSDEIRHSQRSAGDGNCRVEWNRGRKDQGFRGSAHGTSLALPPAAIVKRTQRSHGFTLIELMAVVAMIGVLSALAIVGFKKYMNSSRTGDARAIIGSIRVAEESYRAETLSYLGPSGSLTEYYPVMVPNGKKRHWVQPSHAKFNEWMTLNVVTDSPTAYVFSVVAGGPGAAIPNSSDKDFKPTWPSPTAEPWYEIEAVGDSDGDGVYCYLHSSSFNGEIAVNNETE